MKERRYDKSPTEYDYFCECGSSCELVNAGQCEECGEWFDIDSLTFEDYYWLCNKCTNKTDKDKED
jgi:hypothetical protein